MTERETPSDESIADWFEERADLDSLRLPSKAAPQDQQLLKLLSAGRYKPAEMSESDAAQLLVRIQSRIHTRRVRAVLSVTAAAVAVALALVSTMWLNPPGSDRGQPAPIKHVLFETQHVGKVVRFEMQVYRSQQPAEVSHERAR
jgi:hypothetical protein